MKNILTVMLMIAALVVTSIGIASPVNVNEASAEQLAENLQGVGLKKAKAIVEYRRQNGAFQSESDLLNVKGIGEETLDKNKSNIRLK